MGLFESDEPKIGYLTSPFLDMVGKLTDYQIIYGRVRLKFSLGFVLEGSFERETFSGQGVIFNEITGFKIES